MSERVQLLSSKKRKKASSMLALPTGARQLSSSLSDAASSSSPSSSASGSSIVLQKSGSQIWRQKMQEAQEYVAPMPSVPSLEDDVRMKEEFKYDTALEESVADWIEAVLNLDGQEEQERFTFPRNVSFYEALKSGVILCKVVNKVCVRAPQQESEAAPGPPLVKRIHESSIAFKCIENISSYSRACEQLGVAQEDSFDPTDLFEQKNMSLVVQQISVLANHVARAGFAVPELCRDKSAQTLWVSSLVEGDEAAARLLSAPSAECDMPVTARQRELLTWVNGQFERALVPLRVENLTADLRTGVPLIRLLQVVAQAPYVGVYEERPADLRHLMQNASLVLRFLYAQTFVQFSACSGADIIHGRMFPLEQLLLFVRDNFDLEYLFTRALRDEASRASSSDAAGGGGNDGSDGSGGSGDDDDSTMDEIAAELLAHMEYGIAGAVDDSDRDLSSDTDSLADYVALGDELSDSDLDDDDDDDSLDSAHSDSLASALASMMHAASQLDAEQHVDDGNDEQTWDLERSLAAVHLKIEEMQSRQQVEAKEKVEAQEENEATDAQEENEAIEAQEENEAIEAQEENEATDAQEENEAIEAQEENEATEAQEENEAIEAQEENEATEAQERMEKVVGRLATINEEMEARRRADQELVDAECALAEAHERVENVAEQTEASLLALDAEEGTLKARLSSAEQALQELVGEQKPKPPSGPKAHAARRGAIAGGHRLLRQQLAEVEAERDVANELLVAHGQAANQSEAEFAAELDRCTADLTSATARVEACRDRLRAMPSIDDFERRKKELDVELSKYEDGKKEVDDAQQDDENGEKVDQDVVDNNKKVDQEDVDNDKKVEQDVVDNDEKVGQEDVDNDKKVDQDVVDNDKKVDQEDVDNDKKVEQEDVDNDKKVDQEDDDNDKKVDQEDVDNDKKVDQEDDDDFYAKLDAEVANVSVEGDVASSSNAMSTLSRQLSLRSLMGVDVVYDDEAVEQIAAREKALMRKGARVKSRRWQHQESSKRASRRRQDTVIGMRRPTGAQQEQVPHRKQPTLAKQESFWMPASRGVLVSDKAREALKDANTRRRVMRAQATVRKRVAEQALRGEKAFVEAVMALQRLLVATVRRELESTPLEVAGANGALADVLRHHTSMLAALTELVGGWSDAGDDGGLGALFAERQASLLQCHERYVVAYVRDSVPLKALGKQTSFKAAAKQFRKQREGMTLDDHLVLPLQRIVQYARMLREMLKYTQPRAAEYSALGASLGGALDMLEHLRRCASDAAPSDSVAKRASKLLSTGVAELQRDVKPFVRRNATFPWSSLAEHSASVPRLQVGAGADDFDASPPLSSWVDDACERDGNEVLFFQHQIALLLEVNREMMVQEREVIHTIHAPITKAPLPASMRGAKLHISCRVSPLHDTSVLMEPTQSVADAIAAACERFSQRSGSMVGVAADESELVRRMLAKPESLCLKLIGERSYVIDTTVPLHSIVYIRECVERSVRLNFQLCPQPKAEQPYSVAQQQSYALLSDDMPCAEALLQARSAAASAARPQHHGTSMMISGPLQRTISVSVMLGPEGATPLARQLLARDRMAAAASAAAAAALDPRGEQHDRKSAQRRRAVADAMGRRTAWKRLLRLMSLSPSELQMRADELRCYSVADIDRSFEMRVLSVVNFESSDVAEQLRRAKISSASSCEFWVEVALCHGTKQLCAPARTAPASTPLWSEWVLFSVPFRSLPAEVRLCMTLYARRRHGVAGSATRRAAALLRAASSAALPSGGSDSERRRRAGGGRVALGWVNMNVFGSCGVMASGVHQLRMWPGGAANPIATSVPNSDRAAAAVSVEFLRGPLPLVKLAAPEDRNSIFKSPVRFIDEGDDGDANDDGQFPLKRVLAADPLYVLTHGERQLMWKFRRYCLEREPLALPKVLLAVDWCDADAVLEAHALLREWPLLPPLVALQLLDGKFMDKRVREYAIKCLARFSDNELCNFLLQLVQTLKYEPYHASPLASFLVLRAVRSPQLVGTALFWYLTSEEHTAEVAKRWKLLKKALLLACGTEAPYAGYEFLHGASIMRQLQTTAEHVALHIREPKQRLPYLRAELERVHMDGHSVMPINARLETGGLLAPRCKWMQSNTVPLWLEFDNADPMGEPIRCIFKVGDDLRQDILTLQVIEIMASLWKDDGLDLFMLPYKCVATGDRVGLIEVVMNAKTTASIYREIAGGAIGALREGVLAAWLRTHNPQPTAYRQAVRTFTRSCAGYSVASYVLGIGDRHNDNIMVQRNGNLFHIDFAHILGNYLSFAGIERETTPFVLTPDFVHVISGGAGIESPPFQEFVELCCRAYNVIRRNGHLFLTIFSMMLSTGLEQLESPADLAYLRHSLALHLTERQASKRFIKLIGKSYRNTRIIWQNILHMLANPN
jgi:Phosphatidylinositol 3- and 4-kinase/Phosphoinositide 3-kinase family, accessory domain (PIK domain)/Phosphoinositide 3-kinase C2/Calponin homology (CH) domain/RhoGEF domain